MAALDFPASPTVGQQYVAPNGTTYQWDGAAWVVTGGPPATPSGPAGGDLSGTYPNPSIASQVIVDGDISFAAGINWTKMTANGSVGGDLGGTMPNPTVGPTAKSKWTDDGASLTPSTTTRRVAVGSRTPKFRLVAANNTDQAWLTHNVLLNAAESAWVQDDATKPSWYLRTTLPSPDQFNIIRQAPAGATTTLLTLDNAGSLTLTGTRLNLPNAGVVQTFLSGTSAVTDLIANTGQTIGTTRPSWFLRLDTQADAAQFIRQAPSGGAFLTSGQFDSVGNLTIAGAVGQKASGTTWSNPSDRRIKKDVTDYTRGLAEIRQLRPVSYHYNGFAGTKDEAPDDPIHWSMIADEVELVMPECVGSSVYSPSSFPGEGVETQPAPITLKTLDQSNMILALINAVKELAARVEALESA